ncbi:MAG TPA: hypothetical protein PKH64_06975 [Petrotogaceae bacterium]|nr:hypothetical protein [Petrotogaceae bacterium]
MRIFQGSYQEFDSIFIENNHIKMTIIPEIGGKIASIIYKPQAFEILFQPSEPYRMPIYGDSFEKYDTSGIDEMFPNIDISDYPYGISNMVTLKDHGELWSVPWGASIDRSRVITQVAGTELEYSFKRIVEVKNNQIFLDYVVTNNSKKSILGIWAFHGLLACDEMTQIFLPTDKVINVHDSSVLGKAETLHSFPVTKDLQARDYRLDRIGSPLLKKAEKYYVCGKLKTGQASLTLNKNQLLCKMNFNEKKIPYLGVWINEGGYKNQYNCALEPSTGYYDSIMRAYNNNAVMEILPGRRNSWGLELEVMPNY